MNASDKSIVPPIYWKRYIVTLVFVWTFAVSVSLVWNLYQHKQDTLEMARTQARVAYEKDLLFRSWNAGHGGVYVLATDETPPNPYLNVPQRDITTPSDRLLTLVNPAYMTRQMHELGLKQYGVRGHITSLNPIRPGNAPDLWESEALKSFERGETEVSSIEKIEGESYMRLMRPLFTEESCLKCHADHGFKLGDIRGGISVAVPMQPLWTISQKHALALWLGHSILWLIGLAGIGVVARNLGQRVSERKQAEEDREKLIHELQGALAQVNILSGLLPICAHCKKIRDDGGYWNQIEEYIKDHSEADFSHGICPECMKKHFPGIEV